MKRRIATLVFLGAAALSVQSALAEGLGVIADSATGKVWPSAVENRLRTLSGNHVEAEFPDAGIVTVTGVVTAVYSDTETHVRDENVFNQYYNPDRLEFENWIDTPGVLAVSATNASMGTLAGVAPSIVTNGVLLALAETNAVWVNAVYPDEEPMGVIFNPPLATNRTFAVNAVRPVGLDAKGLHYGDVTVALSAWALLSGSPAVGSGGVALATHDGVTVFESHAGGGGVNVSYDGGRTWTLLPGSPAAGGTGVALATHDGVTVFESHTGGGGVNVSYDGGRTWTLLPFSPAADNYSNGSYGVALATHDGVTVFESHRGGGVNVSYDGGQTWTLLSGSPAASDSGVALATHDGVTVFESHNSGSGVNVSYDGGQTWTLLSGSPAAGTSGGGTWSVALATHDGATVFESHYNGGGVRISAPVFGSAATNTATCIVSATTNDAVSIKDFAVAVAGKANVYCTIETGDDKWSVWSPGESPPGWRTVAQKTGEYWYVRANTNGPMVAASATDAPSALSAALDANRFNRTPASSYSPIYGFDAFQPGRPVRIALTYMPNAQSATNSANVIALHVLSSRFADGYKWDTDTYDIRLVSTNPAVSEVGWPEAVETRSVIFYTPREKEEEDE